MKTYVNITKTYVIWYKIVASNQVNLGKRAHI